MLIEGQFRWKKAKDGGDPVVEGEIPLIYFDGVKHEFPAMLKGIDRTTGNWEQLFEGVKFKYTKVELNFFEEYLFGGINKGNYDWEIEVDSSVLDRIQIYKHSVPTHLNEPKQVF